MAKLPTGGLDLETVKDSGEAYERQYGGIHQRRRDIGKPGSEQAREEPKNRFSRQQVELKASIGEHRDALAGLELSRQAGERHLPQPMKGKKKKTKHPAQGKPEPVLSRAMNALTGKGKGEDKK